jgi:hypothetical protein
LPSGDGTNLNQFAVSEDGLTVTDTITGLVWQRGGSIVRNGCNGENNVTCTWDEAKAYCASLVLAGLSGWRLPAVMELSTIIDFTRQNPSLDVKAFPNVGSRMFWTSSPFAGSSSYAWRVDFLRGSLVYGDGAAYFWALCVR